eukprot:Nk52_evm31s2612 gene=Nk52_evmTU31s2612
MAEDEGKKQDEGQGQNEGQRQDEAAPEGRDSNQEPELTVTRGEMTQLEAIEKKKAARKKRRKRRVSNVLIGQALDEQKLQLQNCSKGSNVALDVYIQNATLAGNRQGATIATSGGETVHHYLVPTDLTPSKGTNIVKEWGLYVRETVDTKTDIDAKTSERDLDIISLEVCKSEMQVDLTPYKKEIIASVISPLVREELKNEDRNAHLEKDRNIFKNVIKTRKGLSDFLFQRAEDYSKHIMNTISENSYLVGKMGEYISAQFKNNLAEFVDMHTLESYEEALKLGKQHMSESVNHLLDRIVLDRALATSMIEVDKSNLMVNFREAVKPTNSFYWDSVLATDGPWTSMCGIRPLILQLIQEWKTSISSLETPYECTCVIAKVLETLHPTTMVFTRVLGMNEQDGIAFMEERLDQFNLHPSTSLTSPNFQEVHSILLDDLYLGIHKQMRFYYELRLNLKNYDGVEDDVDFIAGWTTDRSFVCRPDTYIGEEHESFGICSDGYIVWNAKRIRHTLDLTTHSVIGFIADLHMGSLEIVIDNKSLGPCFGTGAPTWEKYEIDAQCEIIKGFQLIPCICILTGKPEGYRELANVWANEFQQYQGQRDKPTFERDETESFKRSACSLKFNFGGSSFTYNLDNVIDCNKGCELFFNSQSAEKGKLKGLIETQTTKKSSDEEHNEVVLHARKQQFYQSMKYPEPQNFSLFPPSVHRRSISAEIIQYAWRRHKGRNTLKLIKFRMNRAATLIKRFLKKTIPIWKYKRRKACLIIVQAYLKFQGSKYSQTMKEYKHPFLKLNRAALTIQIRYRYHLKQVQARRRKEQVNLSVQAIAIVVLQRWWKEVVVHIRVRRQEIMEQISAILIQSNFRGYRLRKTLRSDIRERLSNIGMVIVKHRAQLETHRAAYKIQNWWRTGNIRRLYKRKRELRRHAATRIQACYKGYLVRSYTRVNYSYGQAVFLEAVPGGKQQDNLGKMAAVARSSGPGGQAGGALSGSVSYGALSSLTDGESETDDETAAAMMENLDITTEDLNLDDFEDDIEANLQDEVVKQALEKGLDLRHYAKQIDGELQNVEQASVETYLTQADNIADLYKQIRSCDDILQEMEKLLNGFQANLGNIGTEIQTLQNQSLTMNLKIKNRKIIQSKLGSIIDDLVISPDMITHICEGEVNEEFVQYLKALTAKIASAKSDKFLQAKCFSEIKPEMIKLRAKAIERIREFMFEKLNSLRKPKTNIQLMQQNSLLKLKYVYQFLRIHDQSVATEVLDYYIETLSKIYWSYFNEYLSMILKLQYETASKDDLIGSDEHVKRGFFASKSSLKNRTSLFSLANRGSVLKEVEDPVIVPHSAQHMHAKYSYEMLFRSFNFIFLDNASSEFLFTCEYFLLKGQESVNVFINIFSKTANMFVKHVENYLQQCHDALTILLCARLCEKFREVMKVRRIPCLEKYFLKLNKLLWPRFEKVIEANIQSLKTTTILKETNVDVHPHFLTRRFAEYCAALTYLSDEHQDEKVTKYIAELSTEVERVILKLAAKVTKRKEQIIFLINNYDLVLSVFNERTSESFEEMEKFKALLSEKTQEFVEVALYPHIGNMIEFVKEKEADPMIESQEPVARGEESCILEIIQTFSRNWKHAIDSANVEVMKSFSNFNNGTSILQAVLTQFIIYYQRFQTLMAKPKYRNMSCRSELINIHHVMVEVKKHKTAF